MKIALLIVSGLALVGMPHNFAMAVEGLSFEAQILEAHKALRLNFTHQGYGLLAARSARPLTLTPIEMFLGWNWEDLAIDESVLKIRVRGDRIYNKNVINFSGDLKATAEPIFPTDSSYGYHLKGPDVDVKIERSYFRGYRILGTYKKAAAVKPVFLNIGLTPTNDGWEVDGDGMNLLLVHAGVYGASIKGDINPNKAGRLELSILGACLGAVLYTPH